MSSYPLILTGDIVSYIACEDFKGTVGETFMTW